MKKTYIAPEMEIIEMNTEMHLLAGSTFDVDNSDGSMIETDDMVGSKNHSFDVWGFDDEE